MTQSWIEVAPASDFPIENLPFGAFSEGGGAPRPGVAIGTQIVDLRALAASGMLDGACDRELLDGGTLNALFEADRWRAVRSRVADLLREGGDPALRDAAHDRILVAQSDAAMHVPVAIGDYVDFYSSLEHATNLGRLFRPDGDPLLPNWRWIPIGYHGRSSTVVIDGTPVVRPNGQRKAPADAQPSFGPSRSLDIELELGFITSRGNALGEPIPVAHARKHVAGFVLVNDWSARDIQAWEYQPLGPFLGKSFATTVSPWIVTLDALEPFRVAGPPQEPPPLAYLAGSGDAAYDIRLEVSILTEKMRASGEPAHVISRTNFAGMYWNFAQQLAHATANGAIARAGDLFASGTISGPEPGSEGSFIEMTWRGERPLQLPNGETRAFLQDGDEIAIHGWCERPGARRIGFGVARGRIAAARNYA
ncbi:MAG TPA: fumarylacetoacetase [Candidatus Acidoferrales bacterium]|jgi:fumarylacetoacetase|nr:fumarylacetoacetase [Candidatus Acidoferrales bacterium]